MVHISSKKLEPWTLSPVQGHRSKGTAVSAVRAPVKSGA